jgi:UDP-GlcNAc:undecaprenyl-phosphate/decaprenyl-phosphate GlcNAc-1-phosphate transferase
VRDSGKPPLARPVASAITMAGVSALAARGAYAGLRRWPPAGQKTWTRSNHRGEPVTLLEGPAVAVGAVTAQVMGQAIGAAVAARRSAAHGTARPLAVRAMAAQHQPERWRASAGSLAVAGLGALAFGVLDDLRGSAARRGLRGHLGALAHGEVTTGAVKLAGLAASGLGAALLEGGRPVDVAINSGLVAGGANLLNLFDLRPGRAIKVAALSACLIAAGASGRAGGSGVNGGDGDGWTNGSGRAGGNGAGVKGGAARTAGLAAVAAPAGAALALLPADLAEQAMLGDAGANALGALLGAAAARSLPRRARLCLLAAIAALTVASEKVSFTRVIAASPPLNWLDMLGRRPAAAAPGSASAAAPEPPPRRRLPGRHRRGGDGESRTRSGAWLSALAKTVARQEP